MKGQCLEVFSIGHSNLCYRSFAALLRKCAIEQVIDVRSIPYSRYVPHFNFGAIQQKLKQSGIAYEYLGNQLGFRNATMRNAHGGISDYRRQIATDAFADGMEQLSAIACKKRAAIMCVEADPYACHRHTILAAELEKLGIHTQHILKDGLIRDAFDQPAIFRSPGDQPIQRSLFETFDEHSHEFIHGRNDALPRVA